MICKTYVDEYNIEDTKYVYTGDAVEIHTSTDKMIVLAANAYVMNSDGMLVQVSTLTPYTILNNVGRVSKLRLVADKHMCVVEKHIVTNVNGFICALWARS